MAKKKNKSKDVIVIQGGYVKTRTPFRSEEVTRGCGVKKDKKKENKRKRCRGKIKSYDHGTSASFSWGRFTRNMLIAVFLVNRPQNTVFIF